MIYTLTRFVRIPYALDYCRMGWMPLPTLAGTYHGNFSVHMAWLCDCAPAKLKEAA